MRSISSLPSCIDSQQSTVCGYHGILFLRINVTGKNFCHLGNQTHDLSTNRLAHTSRTVYHYTKSLSQKTKFIGA